MGNLVFTAGWFGNWFYGIWISLWLLIDNVVYSFINWMYRIFLLVAEVDIFKSGKEIEAIIDRIYIIVGIAMLFIFAYNLILLVINPEGNQLKDMGKIVKNAVVSVIVVTLLPTIFSYLTTIQNHIIKSNVIGQIVLGTSSTDPSANTNKDAGLNTALTIFSAFYHPDGQSFNSCKSGGGHELCSAYVQAYESAQSNQKLSLFIWDDDLKKGAKEDKMEYNWIISTIAGVFALWMFVSFALDIGVRIGKLAFYELISPIPVMMRILPGNGMFKKWFDAIKDTYLSLFVRLAIIYFCMHAITLVPTVFANMWSTGGDNGVLVGLANIVVILGILQFAKDAPKLISDIFKGSGSGVSFGIRKKYKDAAAPLGRVADMARSGVYSKLYGGKDGEGGSFWAGAWRGRNGYQKGVEATDRHSEAVSDGSTWKGRMQERLRNAVGMKYSYDVAGADAEKAMKKEKIEERRERNNKASELIKKVKENSQNIVQAKDSNYRTEVDAYDDFVDRKHRSYAKDFDIVTDDASGKKYDLNGKNYNEMQLVLEEARRNHASSETIAALKKSVSQAKQFADIVDANGNNYNLNGKNYNEMQIELQRAVDDGASDETIKVLKEAMSDFKTNAKVEGKTYNLNAKNDYEMKLVLEEARRNNASSETIGDLEVAIEAFEKQAKDTVITDAFNGDMSKIQDRYQESLTKTINDLQTKVSDGVAQYYDNSGNLVSDVTQVTNLTEFKNAEKTIERSNDALNDRQDQIKKNEKKFKAQRADRDYIQNSRKGGNNK